MLVKNTLMTLLAVAPVFAIPAKIPSAPKAPKAPSSPKPPARSPAKSPEFSGSGKPPKQNPSRNQVAPMSPSRNQRPVMKTHTMPKTTQKNFTPKNTHNINTPKTTHRNNTPKTTHQHNTHQKSPSRRPPRMFPANHPSYRNMKLPNRLPGLPGNQIKINALPGLRISIPGSPFTSALNSLRSPPDSSRSPLNMVSSPVRQPRFTIIPNTQERKSKSMWSGRIPSPTIVVSRRDIIPSPITPTSPYSPLSAMSMTSNRWPMSPYSPLGKHRFYRQHKARKQLHKLTRKEAIQMHNLLLSAERLVNGLEGQLNKPETKFKDIENFKKGQARLRKMQRVSHKAVPPKLAGDPKTPITPIKAL